MRPWVRSASRVILLAYLVGGLGGSISHRHFHADLAHDHTCHSGDCAVETPTAPDSPESVQVASWRRGHNESHADHADCLVCHYLGQQAFVTAPHFAAASPQLVGSLTRPPENLLAARDLVLPPVRGPPLS